MAELNYDDILNAYIEAYQSSLAQDAYLKEIANLPEAQYNELIRQFSKKFIQFNNANGGQTATVYSWHKLTDSEAADVANSVNSNINPGVESTLKVPLNNSSGSGGNVVTTPGVISKTGGTVMAVITRIGQALLAASAGIALGKTIDKTLYNLNPDFWDAHGMEGLNPDTWGEITDGVDGTGAALFNAILGINPTTKETQTYVTQEAFAYMAKWLQVNSAFSGYDITQVPVSSTYYRINKMKGEYPADIANVDSALRVTYYDSGIVYNRSNYTLIALQEGKIRAGSYRGSFYAVSDKEIVNPVHIGSKYTHNGKVYGGDFFLNYGGKEKTYTRNGKTVHYILLGNSGHCYYPVEELARDRRVETYYQNGDPWLTYYGDARINPNIELAMWYTIYGKGDEFFESAVKGIGTQENGKTPILTSEMTIEEVLSALKEQYPELFENAITNTVLQNDGTYKEYTYIPIPTAEAETAISQQPISGASTQENSKISTDTSSETLIDLIKRLLIDSGSTNVPDTGTGDTPPYVAPAGSASSLFAVYNPSQSELDSFGSWLWSGDLIDQLKKLFNDPMQAIIGLHKVFASPPVDGRATIKVGFVDSGVSANKVSSQYITVDCGTVKLNEQFQNVFDYSPYTTIQIYLPFVGVVQLDPADVMRGSISVKYGVDVITGAGLAQVAVTRDNAGGVLYTYPCNCSVTYPVSSGSYIASIGAAIGGAIRGASVGGVIGGIVGAATGSLGRGADIAHSGQFTGNSGAMGIKKPYLIISSPQTMLANNFPHFDGKPTNYTVVLGQCTGFTKVSSVHVEGISATSSELDEIESLLKEGVIIGSVSS